MRKFRIYCHCLHLQQIAELQKENFSLKLRIYFLEDRTKKEGIADGDVYNIVCAFHFLFKTAEFVVDNACSLVTVVIVSIFELHRIWSH